MSRLIVAAALLFFSIGLERSEAQIFADDFNGNEIEPSKWSVGTPFANSSVNESGGYAVLENRGTLVTTSPLPLVSLLDITGRFKFTGNIHDQFCVVLRTDSDSHNPYGVLDSGIYFEFAIQSDTGDTANQIHIVDFSYPNNRAVDLATGSFSLSLNTLHDFRITDDGTNLALYIGDLTTPLLTASDSNSYGRRVGLLNREGNGSISAGSVTQVDFINIVPEPSSLALLGLVGMPSLCVLEQLAYALGRRGRCGSKKVFASIRAIRGQFLSFRWMTSPND